MATFLNPRYRDEITIVGEELHNALQGNKIVTMLEQLYAVLATVKIVNVIIIDPFSGYERS